MGSYDKETPCGTCGKSWRNNFERSCPGHFGHISLEVPVPNYLYLGGSKEPSPLLLIRNQQHLQALLSHLA